MGNKKLLTWPAPICFHPLWRTVRVIIDTQNEYLDGKLALPLPLAGGRRAPAVAG